MKELQLQQRSPEWFQARLGVITGSRAKNVFAKNNLPFIDELIAERLSGTIEETYTSKAMQHGILFEPEAIKSYEEITGHEVNEVGFCVHDTLPYLAVSPDGLVKENGIYVGGVEVKCPSTKTHIEYIRTNRVPAVYKYQVLHYFVVIETLMWVDFVSYDPRVQVRPINIHRVWRNDVLKEIQQTLDAYKAFNIKLEKYERQITGL